MLIIVDGPKCCGKSTLCKTLQSRFGGKIIHFPTQSRLGQTAMKLLQINYEMSQHLMEVDIDMTLAELDPDELWILDRSFISNAVYRGESIQNKYWDIMAKSMVIILISTTENLQKWSEMRSEKPLLDIEKQMLDISNIRFQELSANYELIGEITEIRPGCYKKMR